MAKTNIVKMISPQQKKIIWSIAKKSLQMDSETLYTVIFRMFEKEHMSELIHVEAELLISELKRLVAGLSVDALTEPQYRKIMGMATEFDWSAPALAKYLENEVGVSNVKWLDVRQARIAITGMEKIRSWRKQNEIKEVKNGV